MCTGVCYALVPFKQRQQSKEKRGVPTKVKKLRGEYFQSEDPSENEDISPLPTQIRDASIHETLVGLGIRDLIDDDSHAAL